MQRYKAKHQPGDSIRVIAFDPQRGYAGQDIPGVPSPSEQPSSSAQIAEGKDALDQAFKLLHSNSPSSQPSDLATVTSIGEFMEAMGMSPEVLIENLRKAFDQIGQGRPPAKVFLELFPQLL